MVKIGGDCDGLSRIKSGEGYVQRETDISLLMLSVAVQGQTKAYLHKSTSKMAHGRMVVPGEPVQFPKTRVFGPAKQGISLMGLIGLASLSTTKVSTSRGVLWCVHMACLGFISKR